jgi:uncharacterized protein
MFMSEFLPNARPRREFRTRSSAGGQVPSFVLCSVSEPPVDLRSTPLVIWSISDGRPGHANQARGLIRALETMTPVKSSELPAPSGVRSWFDLLRRSSSLGCDLPDPDIILGVGHRTHPAMLAVRAARGGRAVVLMRPTLPMALFDLAIVPEHDAPKRNRNVITTRGVINAIRPAKNPHPDRGLILLGGPSRHVKWSDQSIIEQVHEIVLDAPDVTWEVTTSRRTPDTMVDGLRERELPNMTITPFAQTKPDWVAEQLERCCQVWVSGDSVSMVYEALTAGAAVGVLHVAQRGSNRVSTGLDQLVRDGLVTPFVTWEQTRRLGVAPSRISEADRCAELIIREWLPRWGLEAKKA